MKELLKFLTEMHEKHEPVNFEIISLLDEFVIKIRIQNLLVTQKVKKFIVEHSSSYDTIIPNLIYAVNERIKNYGND